MTEEEKEAIEEFRKQLRLAINIDDVTTVIRNDNAQIILNLLEKLLKENEQLRTEVNSLKKENEELNEKILDNAEIYQLGFKDGEESYIKKVKDKIEELNKKIDKSIDNSKGGLDEEFIEKAGELLAQKRILQELLEGRKI